MAGLVKNIMNCGLLTSLSSKRISKVFRVVSTFPILQKPQNQTSVCCAYMKSASSQNFFGTSSQVVKVVPFILSDIGEGIKEVTLKEWFVKVGDRISQFDNVCEVQSDKASVTITSRYDGIVTKLHYAIDEIAPVGKPLVDLQINEESVDDTEPVLSSPQAESEENYSHSLKRKVLATPAVRRLAVEQGINLSAISGTGRGGRILKEDILSYLGQLDKDFQKKESANKYVEKQIETKLTTPEDRIELIQGIKKVMCRTMTAANMIPHFVYSDEIDVTELVTFCSQLKKHVEEVKLTYMPFFIKAASKALQKYPVLNSLVDENCERITYKSCHNIGVAMDTPSGLLVPTIKNVQQMGIIDLAEELMRLRKLGLEGALEPSDLTGGTFTLSNIGSIGGTYAKPLILPPEVAIGAIGKVQALPRYDKEGKLIKADILYVSWAADHRIIDGATMARFSNTWKHFIQNPVLLMFNMDE